MGASGLRRPTAGTRPVRVGWTLTTWELADWDNRRHQSRMDQQKQARRFRPFRGIIKQAAGRDSPSWISLWICLEPVRHEILQVKPCRHFATDTQEIATTSPRDDDVKSPSRGLSPFRPFRGIIKHVRPHCCGSVQLMVRFGSYRLPAGRGQYNKVPETCEAWYGERVSFSGYSAEPAKAESLRVPEKGVPGSARRT